MPITIQKQTNRQLHVLLSQSGSMAHKAELVNGFTSGRTEHSSEMFEFEAINMIKWLKQQQLPAQAAVVASSRREQGKGDKADKMRKKILALCHTMGWYARTPAGALLLRNGKPVLDFGRIDAFCTEKTHCKKTLQAHTADELPLLITVFERLLKSDLS